MRRQHHLPAAAFADILATLQRGESCGEGRPGAAPCRADADADADAAKEIKTLIGAGVEKIEPVEASGGPGTGSAQQCAFNGTAGSQASAGSGLLRNSSSLRAAKWSSGALALSTQRSCKPT